VNAAYLLAAGVGLALIWVGIQVERANAAYAQRTFEQHVDDALGVIADGPVDELAARRSAR
jgi:hypothetical protein